MKKRAGVLVSLGVLVILFSSSIERVQKSAGPPSCHAGEPPNNSSCTSCHEGVVNTGSANIILDLGEAENGYIPGKTYTITVSVSKTGMKRAGFQSIILQDSNDKISPGLISLSDTNRIQRLDKNNSHAGSCLNEERVWVEHTNSGNVSNAEGLNTWSWQWQAPARDMGTITFYLAALEANNDLAETGDQVYTRKKTIVALPVGITHIVRPAPVQVFPVPASGLLHILNCSKIPGSIELFNSSGRKIKTWEPQTLIVKGNSIGLALENIPSGIYFLHLKNENDFIIRKVLIDLNRH